MGIRAPSMSLNLPGGNTDYSGLLNFGNNGYAPVSEYLPASNVVLPTQLGAVGAGSVADPTFMQGMLGYTDSAGMKSSGWGTAALGIAQGVASAYSGMKQYGLAKAQFDFTKESYDKNYAAQRATTNASMEDRQRARVASNPGAYQSVGEYMGKHGIA